MPAFRVLKPNFESWYHDTRRVIHVREHLRYHHRAAPRRGRCGNRRHRVRQGRCGPHAGQERLAAAEARERTEDAQGTAAPSAPAPGHARHVRCRRDVRPGGLPDPRDRPRADAHHRGGTVRRVHRLQLLGQPGTTTAGRGRLALAVRPDGLHHAGATPLTNAQRLPCKGGTANGHESTGPQGPYHACLSLHPLTILTRMGVFYFLFAASSRSSTARFKSVKAAYTFVSPPASG